MLEGPEGRVGPILLLDKSNFTFVLIVKCGSIHVHFIQIVWEQGYPITVFNTRLQGGIPSQVETESLVEKIIRTSKCEWYILAVAFRNSAKFAPSVYPYLRSI